MSDKKDVGRDDIEAAKNKPLFDCMIARESDYPTTKEFMHAFFDGSELWKGVPALEEIQAQRLTVKAKYPKPKE